MEVIEHKTRKAAFAFWLEWYGAGGAWEHYRRTYTGRAA